jgi:hypothetical protein
LSGTDDEGRRSAPRLTSLGAEPVEEVCRIGRRSRVPPWIFATATIDVEDLLERQIVADLSGVLGGGEERFAGGEHAAPALAEHRSGAVRLREQLEATWRLLVEKARNRRSQATSAARACRRRRPRRRAQTASTRRCRGLEERATIGEVAVQRAMPTPARRETSAIETSASARRTQCARRRGSCPVASASRALAG